MSPWARLYNALGLTSSQDCSASTSRLMFANLYLITAVDTATISRLGNTSSHCFTYDAPSKFCQRSALSRRIWRKDSLVEVRLLLPQRVSDPLDGILQAHPRAPQRLHADEQSLVVEIRDDIFEPFASLANHHVQGHFDIVIIDKCCPCSCRAGYGDVSRGHTLLSRHHNERKVAICLLDQCQEIVCIRPRGYPLRSFVSFAVTSEAVNQREGQDGPSSDH